MTCGSEAAHIVEVPMPVGRRVADEPKTKCANLRFPPNE